LGITNSTGEEAMARSMLICCLLVALAGCIATPQKENPPDDLSGDWEMTLPAGHVCRSPIIRTDSTHYQIPQIRNLSGLYERRGNLLVVVHPRNERLTEFVWEIQDSDNLVLVESPPVQKVGSDYKGAKLHRVK